MKTLLKQIIKEFHEEILPELIPRTVAWPAKIEHIRKANVFIGMRRAGKTYLMYQHIKELMSKGIEKEKCVYINFEDDRLLSFSVEHFQELLDVYFELYPQFQHRTDIYFYFDEIHTIENWEKFIRRLLDKEKMQIYITGSSAKMLSREIATSLRGRSWRIEVFPLSFQEYINYLDSSTIEKESQVYLQYGGFPETLTAHRSEHRRLLQDYVDTVILRDVIERYRISNSHIVRLLITYCLKHLAMALSVNKLFNDFKSQGLNLTKNSLYEYLKYISDAYLLYFVPIYSLSARKKQVNPKKVYAIDPGMIDAYAVQSAMVKGVSLENAVYMELRRRLSGPDEERIFYYKTATNAEVDFLFINEDESISLYQVTLSLFEPKTRMREIKALVEASTELSVHNFYIITLNEEEEIKDSNCDIQVIPYWKFCFRTSLEKQSEAIYKKNGYTINRGLHQWMAYSLSPGHAGYAIYMAKFYESKSLEKLILIDKDQTKKILGERARWPLKQLQCNNHKNIAYTETQESWLGEAGWLSLEENAEQGFYFRYCSISAQDDLLKLTQNLIKEMGDNQIKIYSLRDEYVGNYISEGLYLRIFPIIVVDIPLEVETTNENIPVPWAIYKVDSTKQNPLAIEFIYIVNVKALDAFINGKFIKNSIE